MDMGNLFPIGEIDISQAISVNAMVVNSLDYP